MTAFRASLFSIRKCLFETEQYILKRSIFYSVTCNNNSQPEENRLELNNEQNQCQGSKKLLKVAMLGLPNVGKSTLVNQLTHRSICPTSSKVHTTMHKAEAVYTEGNIQIVFIDTPGLATAKENKTYKLVETFRKDPQTSATEADVIGIIQDVTNTHTRHKIENFVVDYINKKRDDTKLLLILNKVDKLNKKAALLDLVRLLTSNEKYPKFDDTFMVSALVGDGVDDLRNYLLDSAKVQDWKYDEDVYTNQTIDRIIQQTVRAKLMDILPYEMPYKVKVITEHFDFGDDGSINAVARLDCPRDNYVSVLLKHKAFKVKCLAFHVEKELRHAFRTNVSVRLNVQNVNKSQTE